MKPAEINIGELIRVKRNIKGLKQHELGELIGVTQQTVSKYENNKSKPKDKIWARICEVLEITHADYVHELTENKNYTLVKEEHLQKYLPFEPISDDPDLIDYIILIKKEKQFLTDIGFGNLLNHLSKISDENKKSLSQHLKYYFDLVLNQKKPRKI